MSLFSIIIPAYNRAALIGQTLDSVVNQAGFAAQEREIIVVDDGSTDETLRVVKKYSDQFGVRVVEQKNRGPGAARNLGLANAGGEYVAFLDSDDLWFPWTAATYRRVIEQHGRPGFIAGKPFIFESEKVGFPRESGELETAEFKDYFASGDRWRWYSASSFVMRREALLAVGGFTDEWVNAEDADCAMRMGTAGKFVQVVSPFTFGYRKHGASAMADRTKTFAGVWRLITEDRAGRYSGGSARQRDRERIICRHVRPMALELLNGPDRALAWELYRGTFDAHVRLGRWKFLLGFPARAVATRIGVISR